MSNLVTSPSSSSSSSRIESRTYKSDTALFVVAFTVELSTLHRSVSPLEAGMQMSYSRNPTDTVFTPL